MSVPKTSECVNIDGILSTVVTSTANTAATVTLAASAGARYRIYGYNCLITGAAVVGAITLTLAVGGVTKWLDGVPVAVAIGDSVSNMFPCPIEASAINTAVTFTATAGGASVVTNLSLLYDLV
jgi:hypothetical protein